MVLYCIGEVLSMQQEGYLRGLDIVDFGTLVL